MASFWESLARNVLSELEARTSATAPVYGLYGLCRAGLRVSTLDYELPIKRPGGTFKPPLWKREWVFTLRPLALSCSTAQPDGISLPCRAGGHRSCRSYSRSSAVASVPDLQWCYPVRARRHAG